MEKQLQQQIDTSFKKEVFIGLSSFPKYLSSKYIYDSKGDKLFQDIMSMPKYYLTDCEFEIFANHTEAIGELFRDKMKGLDLIELGAGDGKKTKLLLNYMSNNHFNFVYKPIDISENAIELLTANLASEIPSLKVDAEVGEYFQVLERIKSFNKRKKVILLLGSNIGNLNHPKAIDFLSKLAKSLLPEDILFMGFDQKKDPQTILDAYNDKEGITAAFNKNLLERINRELGGNFQLDKFKHWETYNPETGTAKSFLVSTEAMSVEIKELDLSIELASWESIHTEISQKYDDDTVNWLADQSGLTIKTSFLDSKGYYKNYAFVKK